MASFLPQVREKLGKFGLSDTARDWVIKALDPACPLNAQGIPDTSACSVTRPDYTVQYTIPAPTVSGFPTSTWDCMIVIPPGDLNTLIYATGPNGTDFSTLSAPAFVSWGTVSLQQYIDLPGTTVWVNTVPATGGVYNLAVQDLSQRVPAGRSMTFRHQYKSVTIDLVAAAVADQGDVYAAQYPLEPRSKYPWVSLIPSSSTTQMLVSQAVQIPIPFSEQDMTLSARNPYVGKARDGVYMPIRLMGPTQSYADVCYAGGGGGEITGTGTATSVYPWRLYGAQLPQLIKFTNVVTGGTNGSSPNSGPWLNDYFNASPTVGCDTGYDNTGVGVIFFRGLAAGGGGSGFGASLMVKVIAGLEVCPLPTANERVFQKPPALYEPRALEAYYHLMSQCASAYPARFNALGALLPLLSSAVTRLLPALYAGGRTFLREVIGEEKAAMRPRAREATPGAPALVYKPGGARASSLASRVSSRKIKPKRQSLRKRRQATAR